ncbi:YwpF family protein [Oceanobacillus sp. CAU 1775]
MKTFKLKKIEIVDYDAAPYKANDVPLIDGLIINREDNDHNWLIEAFVEKEYMEYFKQIQATHDELIVHVKITTELNEKATCLSKIIGIKEIGDRMNVLFLGKMIDQRTTKLEAYLQELVEEGHKGDVLLEKFKEKI